MALGLLVCERSVLPFDKLKLDFAFVGAWQSWSYRSQFPQVTSDLAKGLDGVWALTRADSNKHVWCLYWENQRSQFQICPRQPDWTPDNPEDLAHAVELIDGDVPLAGWEELARDFLMRFDR